MPAKQISSTRNRDYILCCRKTTYFDVGKPPSSKIPKKSYEEPASSTEETMYFHPTDDFEISSIIF